MTDLAARLRRLEIPILCALVAGFVLVRLWNLTTFCLDSDEIFSLLCARYSLPHLLKSVQADVVHPPLFYMLLWVWRRIGGESLLWLRLLPFFLSLLALVPVWIIFRQLRLGSLARIIALALLMINNDQVFHARYVRMYALFFLLSLISVALFNSILAPGHPRKRIILLTVVNLLLVYTQYFGWLVVGIEGLHLLIFNRRELKSFAAGTAAIALLFAPWAYAATQAAIAKGGLGPNLGWIRHPKIGDVWWYYVGCDGPLWPVPVASAMVFFLFGFMLAGLWRVFRAAKPLETSRLSFAAMLAFLPPYTAYVVSNMMRNSIWGNRHLIVAAVPYLALLGLGLAALRPKWLRAAVLFIAACWGAFGVYRVTMYPELRNNMDVLTGQLVEFNAHQPGQVTIDFLDPYIAFPMTYFLESHYHLHWNLVNVNDIDQITGDRVWVGYNHKNWKLPQSPEDLLRKRGYQIGPGVWAGDRWDRVAVFLAYRKGD